VASWRLALLAVAVRGGFLATAVLSDPAGRLRQADPDGYLRHAQALLTTGRFALDGAPELFRTPGYPALLVPAVLSGHPHFVAIAVQLGAAALTVVLVYRLALRVTGDTRAARIAALIAVFDPVFVVWSTVPMTETVFTMVATAALLFLVSVRERPTIGGGAALGVLIATATYIRPIAYGLGLVVPAVLAVSDRRQRTVRGRAAAATIAAFVLAVAPWHARNWHVAGYAGFSTLLDRALYLSAGASVAAHEQGRSFITLREARRAAARDTWSAAHDVSADYARFRSQGLDEILGAPFLYATYHATGTVRVLLDPGAVEYLRFLGRYPDHGGGLLALAHEQGLWPALAVIARERPALFLLSLVLEAWLLIVLTTATWGAIVLVRGGQGHHAWMLTGWAAYFLVLSGGAHGISRFRHPIVPILCVFAGAATARLPGLRNARSTPTALPPAPTPS